ncbi:hypothetical protein F4780DRAFT_723482 [Xylariomycetidae sp. FL0641]|nr:hypothetical protein F4780DRAFT_723482 [Xylariomycetidae sp. FL0641]
MTRPHIVRADTLDLQDHEAPSAKDHHNPSSSGSLAAHQAETIREVEEERAEEEGRSPRVSLANGESDLQQQAEDLANSIQDSIQNSLNGSKMQQQDSLAVAQNGGASADEADIDGDDDGLDDDMMDRISSSPSIEDGVYTLQSPWPQRVESLAKPQVQRGLESSRLAPSGGSWSLDFPCLQSQQVSKASAADTLHCHHHHSPGEYSGGVDYYDGNPKNGVQSNDGITGISEPSQSLATASGTSPKSNEPGVEVEYLESTELPAEGDYLYIGRDSGIDVRVEDFSLVHPASFNDSPDDEALWEDVPQSENDDIDDDDSFSFTDDPMFMDSGWGEESLQDAEDIDFEFVYALHTFVATVEGQANATKGDTMVLLDDSNSYWWLVRVVKDSSIGYLPAEHIETPTERLARLNKHRNVDLSASMLVDREDKSKNPLKTAIKKRKAKNVQFTAPTYVDYSDREYSSDEEDVQDDTPAQRQAGHEQQDRGATEPTEEDESAKVEPLKPRGQKQVQIEAPDEGTDTDAEGRRNSDDIFDGKTERTTRNGTVRNTDSFFKDETIETKKITLTPGLLRDDDGSRGSGDGKDLRPRPSFEKELMSDKDKARDDKKKKDKKEKEKEKKPSAIRSFFSRKDRKKSQDDDDESFGKRSMDIGGEFGDKELVEEPQSMDSEFQDKGAQRQTGKLQKHQPRHDTSPTRKSSIGGTERTPLASEARTKNITNVPPATTLRMVESEPLDRESKASPKEEKSKVVLSKILPSSSSEPKQPKPPKVTKAKSRVELDDFDSSEEEEEEGSDEEEKGESAVAPAPTRPAPEPQRQPSEDKLVRPSLPGAFPDSYISTQPTSPKGDSMAATQRSADDRYQESPTPVSPLNASEPPALMGDTSSQEGRPSPVSSPSPEPAGEDNKGQRSQDAAKTPTSPTTPTWDDAKLKAFFDSPTEIKDLMTIVYDTTDVPPAGPDHPVAGKLFREEQAKLAEITTQLDHMLADFLSRKRLGNYR